MYVIVHIICMTHIPYHQRGLSSARHKIESLSKELEHKLTAAAEEETRLQQALGDSERALQEANIIHNTFIIHSACV